MMMQQQRQMIPHPMSRMPPIPPEPIMTMSPQQVMMQPNQALTIPQQYEFQAKKIYNAI